jgi:tryptophan synthase alpha chain
VSAAGRIARRFDALKREGRSGLVTFVTAGDPDAETSAAILNGLPAAGADIVELGMPFTDPMADGPAIQLASQRALKAGQTMDRTLAMVRAFRATDDDTPVVLMGYYNPIYVRGVERFAREAAEAGVDGLIVVDLPPEEDAELRGPASEAGIDLVRLTAPTSDEKRLPALVNSASGFLYHVSVAGVTGTKTMVEDQVREDVARIRRFTRLPVAVGFGIRTPEQAERVARIADAAVVGTAIVERIAAGAGESGSPDALARSVLQFVSELAAGVRRAHSVTVGGSDAR